MASSSTSISIGHGRHGTHLNPIVLISHSRFPKVKVIVGHLGERITSDLFRIDERRLSSDASVWPSNNYIYSELARQVSSGMPMLRNVSSYWKTNLFETTSGNFATPLLRFHIDQIGLDRILYSVDYPFVQMTEGATWINSLPMNHNDLIRLKRGLAIDVLGLNK
jgi:2,3-dihydroxybenzoate decarboxylase